MQIPCPWCGTRDEAEFVFGGESHIRRPAEAGDADWTDYLFNRSNPRGIHHERWCHSYGCQQWFNVARHTLTHDIVAAYEIGERPPAADQGGGR